MKNKMMMIAIIAIFAVGMFGGTYIAKFFNQPSEADLEITTNTETAMQVPEFSLLALDGVRENSNQWQGKVRVINFWATWCQPCKKEIPILVDLQKKYGPQGLQVIGIALDKKENVRDFVQKIPFNYPILVGEGDAIDTAMQLGNEQGVIPFTVIVDQNGVINSSHYGQFSPESIETAVKQLL